MNTIIKNVKAALPDENGAYRVDSCDVCIDSDIITCVGEAPADYKADKVINGEGFFAVPGFVNSHTHVYMTLFRNRADDLLFNDWLFGNILPLEDKLLKEDTYWGSMLGCMEMIKTGTTSFLDMYIFPDTAARGAADSGMRAVLSRGLTGGEDDVEGGKRRLAEARAEIAAWRGTENLSFMLAPHAPYSCDPGYMRTVAQAAAELDVGIHTHISESRSEMEQIREKYGCTPPELMDRAGLLTPRTVAAHCVYLTDSDMALMAERGVNAATNPVSNLKLGNGIARVPEMMQAGMNVCMGTDGAASNNALNMFRDLSFLTLIHKGRLENAVAVSAAEGLKIATENGAKALGLKNVGAIKPGWKADISLLRLDSPTLTPENNLVSALAYSANGSEVDTVIINGKTVYEHGEFKTIDAEKVIWNVRKTVERFQ